MIVQFAVRLYFAVSMGRHLQTLMNGKSLYVYRSWIYMCIVFGAKEYKIHELFYHRAQMI